MSSITKMDKLNPLNKTEQKLRFFFDVKYNPQFVYAAPLSLEDQAKYGEVSAEYVNVARKILDTVISRWKTETAYLDEAEGPVLSREELTAITREYLIGYGLEQKIRVNFSSQFISATSRHGNMLNFRLPIVHRQKRLLGTLDHEVGTHFFRSENEARQPWAGKREAYGFHPYLETEEGLAVLNAHLFVQPKYLWFTALYYYAVYQASKMSFADLFTELQQYVDDKERRWNICLRAKRGATDTSQPFALAKDQVYLRGTIKVLAWLRSRDYNPTELYLGKIAFEDVERARRLAPEYVPQVPECAQNVKLFAKHVQEIEKENFLTDLE